MPMVKEKFNSAKTRLKLRKKQAKSKGDLLKESTAYG
jgi:hypothetical protein